MRISKKNLVFQNRGLRLQIFQERWIIICFEAHFQFQKKAYLLFFFFLKKKKNLSFKAYDDPLIKSSKRVQMLKPKFSKNSWVSS